MLLTHEDTICSILLSNAAGPQDHELIVFGSFTLPLLATCEKLGFGGCKLTSRYTSEALTWRKRKSSVLIPCITTLVDAMMNALLTCVVSNNKCEDGAEPDRGSCRCLVGTVMAGSIAINRFHIVLPGAHLELFAFISYMMSKACWIFSGLKHRLTSSRPRVMKAL